MGPLIFLLITCAAVPAGARLLRVLRLAPPDTGSLFLMATAVGYGLIGYGTLVLGLTRHLTPWAAAVMLAAFAIAGLGHWNLLWEAALRGVSVFMRAFRTPFNTFLAGSMLLLAVLTIITALEPPAGRDFDGLAEHLAQASHYVRHSQIEPLWYDHHSHFPANMTMLYTLALLYGSTSAAKLFHWFCGLVAVLAVFLIARRHTAKFACGPAALVLATTPMFIWLLGLAYVDLGLMACDLLALLAFLNWRRDGQPRSLVLAGLLAGLGMAIKMQGLFFFGIMLVAALIVRVGQRESAAPEREDDTDPVDDGGFKPRPEPPATGAFDARSTVRPRSNTSFSWRLKWTLIAGLLGALVASPWYVRTTLNTGNPFYPFAYSIFGGKHWSADRALGYQRHQLEFGLGDLPSQEELDAMPRWQRFLAGPREPWKWLVAPFGLTFRPWDYEVNLGHLPNLLMTSVGPLWLGLLPLLLLIRPRPPAIGVVLWMFLALWLWWFASMQLGRYLMPNLALLAPVAGFALHRLLHGGRWGRTLGTIAAGLWATAALAIALLLAAPAAPVVLGLESRDEYLHRNLDVYTPSAYIAQNLPPQAKVATYGEVRCFYFNRDCFWAEPGHSDLIPYETMRGPEDLIAAYRQLGITHVLLNQTHLPGLWGAKTGALGLLVRAIEQGQLRLLADFPNRRQFLLFEVAPEWGA